MGQLDAVEHEGLVAGETVGQLEQKVGDKLAVEHEGLVAEHTDGIQGTDERGGLEHKMGDTAADGLGIAADELGRIEDTVGGELGHAVDDRNKRIQGSRKHTDEMGRGSRSNLFP